MKQLITGVAPSASGILANERWHAEHGEESWIADPSAPVLGDPASSASPRALRVATVADALKAATQGPGKVVSVSVKDRGAVIPGGEAPDLALWYSAKTRGFTTPRYYGAGLPECAARFARENPSEGLLAQWLPDPRVEALGRDDAPGEGEYLGWSRLFPHDPRRSDAPWSVLKLTPALTNHSLALAGACATALGLGDDDAPDLLALSLSATDYAGHVYGPESQEYADSQVRTDRALGRLLRALESRTRLAALISADHGVAPLPESSGKGGRIVPKQLVVTLEQKLDARLGAGDYVAVFVAPFVTLTASARSRREQVLPALLAELAELEGVHSAHDVRDAERLRASADPVERAVGQSLDAEPPGDAFVVPAEGWSVDPDMAVGAGYQPRRAVGLRARGPCAVLGTGRQAHARQRGPGLAPRRADHRGAARRAGAGDRGRAGAGDRGRAGAGDRGRAARGSVTRTRRATRGRLHEFSTASPAWTRPDTRECEMRDPMKPKNLIGKSLLLGSALLWTSCATQRTSLPVRPGRLVPQPSVSAGTARLTDAGHTFVLVALDGVRHEDVFRGVDRRLAKSQDLGERELLSARELTPNLHALMDRGAALAGSSISASGPNFMSVPGYLEMLTGRRPTGCASNSCPPTTHPTLADDFAQAPGVTPLEVAVIASWEGVARAAARDPSTVTVSVGRHTGETRERLRYDAEASALLDAGEKAGPDPGHGDYRRDRETAAIALRYLKKVKPRFLFLGLGGSVSGTSKMSPGASFLPLSPL